MTFRAGVVGLNLIVCKRMADSPKSFSSPGVPASHSPCVPGSRRSVMTDATLPLCQGDCLQGVSQARFWVIYGPQHRSLLSSASVIISLCSRLHLSSSLLSSASVIISLCCPCPPFLAGAQAPGRLDQRRVEAGQGGGLSLRDPRTASHMPAPPRNSVYQTSQLNFPRAGVRLNRATRASTLDDAAAHASGSALGLC